MSVVVLLHKSKYVQWHNVAIYSAEVKKSKANQEITGHAWIDENNYYYKACFKSSIHSLQERLHNPKLK